MEYTDIYDEHRNRTGIVKPRFAHREPGEYGLVVCVWVYDGRGHLLLTRRAPEKSFPGTWENSGGAARAGEDSLSAIQRELREETGIRMPKEAFEFLSTTRDAVNFYDHYCVKWDGALSEIILLPGETDDVVWADFDEVHALIRQEKICAVIAEQFLQGEKELRKRQTAQETT